jgi:hypothetical protein
MSEKQLKREDILAIKPRTATVNVPELGGVITLRRLSFSDKLKLPPEPEEGSADVASARFEVTLSALAMSAIDDEGKLLFPDVGALRPLICDVETVKELSAAIRELNKVTPADETSKN